MKTSREQVRTLLNNMKATDRALKAANRDVEGTDPEAAMRAVEGSHTAAMNLLEYELSEIQVSPAAAALLMREVLLAQFRREQGGRNPVNVNILPWDILPYARDAYVHLDHASLHMIAEEVLEAVLTTKERR